MNIMKVAIGWFLSGQFSGVFLGFVMLDIAGFIAERWKLHKIRKRKDIICEVREWEGGTYFHIESDH